MEKHPWEHRVFQNQSHQPNKMDKTPLYFLFVAAVFGGILCDTTIKFGFPFFTIAFVLMAAIIYFVATKPRISDEEE